MAPIDVCSFGGAMATIDTTKPASAYDVALAPQPRMTQARGQLQQQQQALQSAAPQPSGGADTQSPLHGATTPQPAFEQGMPSLSNYNSGTPLSNVLPPDGGTGEAALAGGTAASNAWLNSVDFTNPLFALEPLAQDDTAAMQASADDASTTTDAGVNSGFTQGSPDNVLAQRMVNAATDDAERQARAGADGIGDLTGPDAAADASNASNANNAGSANIQDANTAPQMPQGQASTSAQLKARDPNSQSGGKAAEQALNGDRPGQGGTAEGRAANSELANELNTFLMQQLLQQNPKENPLLALLRGEEALTGTLETAQTLRGAHGENAVSGGLGGGAGALGGAGLSDARGALGLHGAAALLAQGGEQALNDAVLNNTRMLVMLMSNMPAAGTSQPVLAMIAADIFRLQSMRLELMALSRGADEDGEMPPIDEDEAAMKRRQVQGIDLSGMWRWDLRPTLAGEPEEKEEQSAQIWFRTALLTCALQRPNLVAPMFKSTAEAHSVRLFEHNEVQETFDEQWVQIPGKQAALAGFAVNSEHFATWVNLAEKAFAHARLGPIPVVSEDRGKNAKAQAAALQAITGKPAYTLARAIDEDEDARRTFFKAVCRSNAPHSLPTVITTCEATFTEDGLRPSYAYGVLGAFVKDKIWSVILCEDRGSDPKAPGVVPAPAGPEGDPSFRIFAVPYQALERNAAAAVFLPG